MNDIVITFDKIRDSEDNLRQILRGIENHCEGFNEIFIIGDLPDFVQGVVHIGFSGAPDEVKHKNNYKKLKAACINPKLTSAFCWIDGSDEIVAMDVRKPNRVLGQMSVSRLGKEKITLEHTLRMMSRRGFLDGYVFFNRYPMTMSKRRLMNTFDEIDFETKFGYCIKTMYVNFNRLLNTNTHKTIQQQTEKCSYEKF